MSVGKELSAADAATIERALADAEHASGFGFNAQIGPLGADPRTAAEGLHGGTVDPAHTVLVAIDPQQRALEIVTGEQVRRSLTDGDCQLAAATMVSSIQQGDFLGGITSGIRQLGAAARPLPVLHARDARELSA